jgi:hypothetical protein
MSGWDVGEVVVNSKRSVKMILILAILAIAGVVTFYAW